MVVARHRLRPSSPEESSKHTLWTLLLVGVGGFITLLGMLASVLFVAFLTQSSSVEPELTSVVVVPLGALTVGAALVLVGLRLAR